MSNPITPVRNRKCRVGQHGPMDIPEVGSSAFEE